MIEVAYCPECKEIYKEPEEEAGSFPCPRCGMYPWDEEEDNVQEEN